MTSFPEAVHDVLAEDDTLAALATGGIWTMDALGRDGLTISLAQDTASSDEVGMPPAIVIRMTSQSEFGEADATLRAERWFMEIYFYEDSGYATIQQMMSRVKTLLNRQRVQFDTASYWVHLILWRGDVPEFAEESLSGASAARSRYEVHLTRV